MKSLSLSISAAAALRLANFLATAEVADPIPAILFGRRPDEAQEKWSVGVYSRSRARQLHDLYQSRGLHALVCVDNMELCIPQTHLHAALEGKTLDVEGDTLVVR